MRIEYGTLIGDQQLAEDMALYGVASGSLTVGPGRELYLYGLCCANLTVEAGATATVLGTVAGNVVNRGTVILHGLVQGSVHTKGARFEKSPASVISGTLES